MKPYFENVIFEVFWVFKEHQHLKLTKDKRIIDTRKKKFLVYGDRGYFINGKYYKRKDLNPMIEKIPKRGYMPF